MTKLKKYLLKQICENPYSQELQLFLEVVNKMESKIKDLESKVKLYSDISSKNINDLMDYMVGYTIEEYDELKVRVEQLENYEALAEATMSANSVKIDNQKRKLIEIAHDRNDLANKLKEQEKYVELGRAIEEALDENVMYISDLDESINISSTNELLDWYRENKID